MTIGELIEKKDDFVGKNVSIESILIIGNDLSYLSDESNPNSPKILVELKGLTEKLLEEVPCYIGGPNLYHDQVSIEGKLKQINNDSFDFAIHNIKTLTMTRNDERYELIFE